MFEKIKEKNPNIRLFHVKDKEFSAFGRVIQDIDCTTLLEKLAQTEKPAEGNIYVASDESFETLPVAKKLQTEIFGHLPIQIGYCNGNGFKLNAMEYHKCPELNLSTDDIILFLGKTTDIDANVYDTKNALAFYVPKETLIELYGTTMHFAPCKTSQNGFKTLVVLLKGTNEDFKESVVADDSTLFKVGKWLLNHPENEIMKQRGASTGLKGINYEIKL